MHAVLLVLSMLAGMSAVSWAGQALAACAHNACHAVPTATAVASGTPVPSATPGGLTLAFQDNFDGTTLDTSKWTATTAQMFSGYGAEHWNPANCVVSGGLLHLIIKADLSSCDVRTFGHFSATSGYAEALVRVPAGDGLWPAFWLMSALANVAPDSFQEIDVAEDHGNNVHVTGENLHWGAAASHFASNGSYTDLAVDYSQAFHRYGVRWSATEIDFSVDGIVRRAWAQPSPAVIYDPMTVRLSLSVCKTGLSWCPAPDSSTVYPADLQVDLVVVDR